MMKPDLKIYNLVAAAVLFIGVPIALYAFGDFPRRSWLKEGLSIATLLAFSLMMGQFFLARSNLAMLQIHTMMNVQRLHKAIAYGVLAVVLLHPFLIVLPRYFEAGVDPVDALVTMLTSFNKPGVVLGEIAWVSMLVLSITSIFRMRLIKRFKIKYRNWRYFHGGLSVVLVLAALIHSIALGRHTDAPMMVFEITLTVIGLWLLAKLYFGAPDQKPATLEAKA